MSKHSVRYDADNSMILIEYHGVVHKTDVKSIRSRAIELTNEHQCHLSLTDFRDATFELSTLDIVELPESTSKAYSENDLSVANVKRAIVVGDGAEELEFLETVSINRGQNVKLFHDFDQAKAWLLGD
ncbi:MAG: hypothetical protein CMQ38_05900 [Gammaproteobacteria bacterium]|nr:hypothetical protein [Gammaproteobacteria bacterium]|tara:strand:- start:19 stop:402 length:384 start_codon:yes stop_codon:yes gene_type:complete